jgi:hypothetical protein
MQKFKNSSIFHPSCRTRHRGGPKNSSLELWKKNRYLASGSFKGKDLV